MSRMVIARERLDDLWREDDLDRAVKAFSLKHRGAYCHGAVVFGCAFVVAYKHRSYGDVGQWHALDGYYRNGVFLPFTRGERITEQNAGITCQ